MLATASIQASSITTDPTKQEFPAILTDTTLPCNRCKRCHRKIKAPQEYGRVCARKIRATTDTTDTDSDKAGITKFDIIAPVGTHVFTSHPDNCNTPSITSTSELTARLENKTASVGMCWACRKQRRCETSKTPRPQPVVVCTAFHEFHHMRP